MAEIVLMGEVQDLGALPVFRRSANLLDRLGARLKGKVRWANQNPKPLAPPGPKGDPARLIVRPRPLVERPMGLGLPRPRPVLGLARNRAMSLREHAELAGVKKKPKAPKLPALMKPMAPPPGISASDLQLGAQLAAEAANGMRPMPVPMGLPATLPQPGLMDRVSGGIQQGTSWVERLGGQVVNVLDAGARLKQATAMQKWQVGQAWDRFQGQSWFDLELIPGVKNLYLALGAGGLLAVLLMNRGK